jgi:hypothetical protein
VCSVRYYMCNENGWTYQHKVFTLSIMELTHVVRRSADCAASGHHLDAIGELTHDLVRNLNLSIRVKRILIVAVDIITGSTSQSY